MSFGGAASGMNNTIKANRALKNNHKTPFEVMKDGNSHSNIELHFKDANEKEMEAFRKEWDLKVKAMKRRKLAILGISIVSAAGLIYGFTIFFGF